MSDLQTRLAKLSPEKRALLAQRLASKGGSKSRSGPAALPEIQHDPDHRYDPFPLTELQQAYWIGRCGSFEMGQVAGHSYIEIERDDFDVERLNKAWCKLIERHDMLRAIFQPDGNQKVLEQVPAYKFPILDLREEEPDSASAKLEKLRYRISHQVLPSDQWPLFEIHAALLLNGRTRLHIAMDALIIDGWSIAVIFKEWKKLYENLNHPLEPLELTFRDYVAAERTLEKTDKYKRDRDYWINRLETLPRGPELPLAKNPSEVTEGRFVRRTEHLDRDTWGRIKERASQKGLTSIAVLLTAYWHVIAVWSRTTHFTVNVPQFNRFPMHPQVNSIIGESASFNLLEANVKSGSTFEERARHTQDQLIDDIDHNFFSGISMLREIAKKLGGVSGSLNPVVFTGSAKDKDGRDAFITNVAGEMGEVIFSVSQTPQVYLDNHISEQNGALHCDWDTVEELFPENLSEDMLQAFLQLLKNLAKDERSWEHSWPEMAKNILPSQHLEARSAINSRTRPIPEVLIQDLFIQQVPKQKDRPAVISNKRTISYEELNSLSNQWGRRLRELGVKPNTLVAVVMEKGWEQIVAALGIIQSGGAYAPIDADQPEERLLGMIENSRAEFVLTQSWLDEKIEWPANVRSYCVDTEDLGNVDSAPLEPVQKPEDLAYIIFTSGSTGHPKGVMISHKGAVNAVLCTNDNFKIGPEDRVLAVTALHHDMSVYDIFGMLGAGGTIIMPDPEGRKDPVHWSDLMLRHKPTVWNSVPAMMEMLLEFADTRTGAIPETLRIAFLGGDWIPITTPDRLSSHVPGGQVVSVGGPTETTLWNIWYPVEKMDPTWKSIPYGQPISNVTYYILNEALESCPVWVPGEICCAGVCLAKGYWQDEDKTAEKFIIHPRTGERIYRTGDLGRYLPDGNIEFVGRKDFMIKINGQRIEPGEIEAALLRLEGVQSAVVVAVGKKQGKKRLVAYVVPAPDASLTSSDLRQALDQKVPEYMVPSEFAILNHLPLTANGKVDRKALPEINVPQIETGKSSGTQSSVTQAKVVELVSKILELDSADPEVNLITLGANSIDMIKIGNLIEKEFGFRPRMDEIFRLQTINAIAVYCDSYLGGGADEASADEVGLDSKTLEIIRSFKQLIEPKEREDFKNSQKGIRRGDEDKSFIQLERSMDDEEWLKKNKLRRSHRRFSLNPIPLSKISEFLGCLRELQVDGKPKYLYASPGALYPTQTYLHFKPGRVIGVDPGTYYYHPKEHRLILLTPGAVIDSGIHVPFVNTPVAVEAGFTIFIVTDLAAIAPSYGENSVYFATLEAGVMAHALEISALEAGIGLCQIGGLDFPAVRDLFCLDNSHYYVHSLLGGSVDTTGRESRSLYAPLDHSPGGRASNLLDRITPLSSEEVKILIEGKNSVNGRGTANE